jgi:hypothetical protein
VQRTFAIAGGHVDLDASAFVVEGQVVRLAPGEARVLAALLRWERRALPLAELATEARVGDDDPADLRAVLRGLAGRLGGGQDQRPPLRILGDDRAGLWPERREVEDAGACALVAVGFDARRLAFRGRPEAVERAWIAERDRWIAAYADLGGHPIEEGAGAVVLRLPAHAPVLSRARATRDAADSALRCRLRVAIERCRWSPQLVEPAIDAAISRLSRLWERVAGGRLALTDDARRAFDDGLPLVGRGGLRLRPDCAPVDVWLDPGVGGLLPAVPEPVLPVATFVPRELDLLDATLSALDGGARLVVLHGPTGVGKTDVAFRTAHVAQGRLRGRGGALAVRIDEDGRSLAETVASELGLLGADDPVRAVGDALAALGEALLVLDGFEHAGDEAPETLLAWRAAAPDCALLLTSDRPVRLPGAVHVRVEPWATAAAVVGLRRALSWRGVHVAEEGHGELALRTLASIVGGMPVSLGIAAGLVAREGLEDALRVVRGLELGSAEARLSGLIRLVRGRLPDPLGRALDRLAIARGDLDVATAGALVGDSGAIDDILDALVRAGFVRARPDAVLGELRFSIPGPIRAVFRDQLPRAERQRLWDEATHLLVRRAAGWARAVDGGGDELRPLRRLYLEHRALLGGLAAVDDPALRGDVLLGLLRLSALGRISLPRLEAIAAAGPGSPAAALVVARGRLLANDGLEAEDWARRAEAGEGAVGDAATVLRALAARGTWSHAEARHELVALCGRWLAAPSARSLPAAGGLLDALIAADLVGDALQLATALASVAEGSGARWRRQVVRVHGLRARWLLGRGAEADLGTVVEIVDDLQEIGDHRAACLTLQWAARHEVASGRPAAGLAMLDRVHGYLDVYVSAALRQLVRLDRARALALLRDTAAARDQLRAIDAVADPAARLPTVVRAVDGALVAWIEGDAGRVREQVGRVDLAAVPAEYSAILRLLLAVAEGRPAASAGLDRLPRELVALAAAWPDPARRHDAVELLAGRPVARSLGLLGVVARALIVAARGPIG